MEEVVEYPMYCDVEESDDEGMSEFLDSPIAIFDPNNEDDSPVHPGFGNRIFNFI